MTASSSRTIADPNKDSWPTMKRDLSVAGPKFALAIDGPKKLGAFIADSRAYYNSARPHVRLLLYIFILSHTMLTTDLDH
jgi:hypothetical protein